MPLPAAAFFIENFHREGGDITSLGKGRLLIFNGDSVEELTTCQERESERVCVCVCVRACVRAVILLFVGCPTPSQSHAACVSEQSAVRLIPCWAQTLCVNTQLL